MAIVPMKRLAIVAPVDAQDALLHRLQELGALHLTPLAAEVEPPAELQGRLTALRRQRAALAAFAVEGGAAAAPAGDDDAALLAAIERALGERNETEAQLHVLVKEEAQALPWGEAVRDDVHRLRAAGARVQAWRVRPEREKDLVELPAAEGVYLARWAVEGHGVGLVTVQTREETDTVDEPRDSLWRAIDVLGERIEPPPRGLGAVRAERAAVEGKLSALAATLGGFAAHGAVFEREEARVTDRLGLAMARAGAQRDEHLVAFSGWCPREREEALRAAVLEAKGALLASDPGPDDAPPVALRNGRFARLFEPLLGAFQLPHYGESDPTVLFAPFMGIFFGFCLGDAGYGVILFTLATLARRKLVKGPDGGGEMGKAIGLIQILGLSTILIGGLTGNLFGIKLYTLEALSAIAPALVLSPLDRDPANFFYAALLFGVAQLSFGLLLQLIRNLRRSEWQRAVGSLGWLLVIPGIALWVAVGPSFLFLGALGLILFFNSPSPRLIARIGGGAWALYNVTSLFGDVMSYARIFGLGLSSGIIAVVVNTIAATMADGVVGYVAALLVLLVGHSFNFAMAVIGSIVHPARLQFLEFFGKFFEGGGAPYRPLTRISKGGK